MLHEEMEFFLVHVSVWWALNLCHFWIGLASVISCDNNLQVIISSSVVWLKVATRRKMRPISIISRTDDEVSHCSLFE